LKRPAIALMMVLALAASCSRRDVVAEAASGNIIRNASFEEGSAPIPEGWQFENKANGKGSVSYASDRKHTGTKSLKLSPNGKNKGSGIAANPLGVGQGFPGSGFAGKSLHVSGWLAGEGGATAVLGVYALKRNGSVEMLELTSTSGDMGYQHDVLSISNDKGILFLIVNCHARGESGNAYFDDIYVGFEPPMEETAGGSSALGGGQPAGPLTATVTVSGGRDVRPVPKGLYGTNIEWIWDGNSMLDASGQLDPELMALVREMGITEIRFPGGIMADFYHWKDGIGPRGSRKTTESMPGGTKSVHNFGTDEALELSKQLNAPLTITANIITGSPGEAVEWLRYIRERTGPGKAPPVTYWELGNEQYVRDGSPHAKVGGLTPKAYSERIRPFVQALRAADSSVKVGAIADENFSSIVQKSYGTWTDEVLQAVGREVDFLAVHNAYAPAVINPAGRSVRDIYRAMFAAPVLIEKQLAKTSEKVAAVNDRMKIAVTEWGPFFHLAPDSPYLDHPKTLGSAIFVASTMKAFMESPRVDRAHFFKLSDQLFMGWIGKRDGHWAAKSPYFAFQMFSRYFGDVLLDSKTVSPTFASRSAGWVQSVPEAPFVEAIASRSQDGKKLYVIAINKSFDSDVAATFDLQGVKPRGGATVRTLSGDSVDANTGTKLFEAPGVKWAKAAEDEKNPRMQRGGADQVRIASNQMRGVGSKVTYTLPKLSVTSLEIELR
jgi:alpha-N-arabinofuranosidase